jgi:hypothetical protein
MNEDIFNGSIRKFLKMLGVRRATVTDRGLAHALRCSALSASCPRELYSKSGLPPLMPQVA